MPEVTEGFLQQFVDGLKESAAAQQASAGAMNAIATELREQARDAKNGRTTAVDEVKNHVTVQLKLANRWPSILLGVLTALATLAVGILGLIAAQAH